MESGRHAAFAAGALCVGLVGALAIAELAVRLASIAPPLAAGIAAYSSDSQLPFKTTPLKHLEGSTPEFTYDYRHNSVGFRDVEHDTAKAPGTFRILGLGDSFTYGIGAAFEETYLYRLEAKLAGRFVQPARVEIIKAGIPRFFPLTERLLLEHYGKAYRPDLILVGVLPNDVIDTYLGIDAVRADPAGFLRTRQADELGKLGLLIYKHFHLGRLVLRLHMDRQVRPRWDELYRDNGHHEPDWLTMEQEYGKMADIADSIGATLVLAHIPQRGPWADDARYVPTRLAAWAARRGVHFVDILPAMEQSGTPETLYYPMDGHCTPAGYEVIAETLATALVERKLVP